MGTAAWERRGGGKTCKEGDSSNEEQKGVTGTGYAR